MRPTTSLAMIFHCLTTRPRTGQPVAFWCNAAPAMLGMLCIVRGYEVPDDWLSGRVLIDPGFRRQGIGNMVAIQVKDRVRASNSTMLKFAVLAANHGALCF